MSEVKSINQDKIVTLGNSSQEFDKFCVGELERRKNAGGEVDIPKIEGAMELIRRKLNVLEEGGRS
ncbi:MAG: hypothetical protein HQL48_11345 [Gammaproteobacteria bacterium]|nr:hypothetical protein [Gammaproteobacteria bacterium]